MALRELMWSLALFIAFCSASVLLPNVSAKVVGCYFGSWAGYRLGDGRFEPENIDASLCTHFFYAFVGITSDGNLRITDEYNDLPGGKNFFGRFNDVKKRNPSAKTLLAVGGWNEGSITFTKVANSAELRKAFAVNAVNFLLKYSFDGLDMDWEYPADRGGAPSDLQGFVEMLKELRTQFDKHGLLLTAAVGVAQFRVGTGYDVSEMCKYLDYVNMMTYDLHGSWEDRTGHHAALYPSQVDTSVTDLKLNVDATIQHWLKSGAPASKLVLGIGTYGRTFTLSGSSAAIGAPAKGPGIAGPHTQEAGSLGYHEICVNIKHRAWTVVWDDHVKSPYAYSGNQWVGYDNPRSAWVKTEYADKLGLAGVFIWSLETEDFKNLCGDGSYPILHAMNNALNISNPGGGDGNEPGPGDGGDPTKAPPPGASTAPTRPPPGGSVCTAEGHARDPTDCQVFYYCQPDGRGGFTAHKFTCSGNLVFDPALSLCNYRELVPGCA